MKNTEQEHVPTLSEVIDRIAAEYPLFDHMCSCERKERENAERPYREAFAQFVRYHRLVIEGETFSFHPIWELKQLWRNLQFLEAGTALVGQYSPQVLVALAGLAAYRHTAARVNLDKTAGWLCTGSWKSGSSPSEKYRMILRDLLAAHFPEKAIEEPKVRSSLGDVTWCADGPCTC